MADYPHFPLYVEDFDHGTGAMSPLEVGIYIRMLCYQWSHGSVPSERSAVARLARALPAEVEAAWPAVSAKFKDDGSGGLQNQRLEAERQKLLVKISRLSAAGKAGAKARYGNRITIDDEVAIAEAVRLETESHEMANGKQDAVRVQRASDSVFDSDSPSDSGSEEGGAGETKPHPLAAIPSKRLHAAVDRWLAYKGERREGYKPTGLQAFYARVVNVASTQGPQHVIHQMDRAMANGWKGWEHDDNRGSPKPAMKTGASHVFDPSTETRNEL